MNLGTIWGRFVEKTGGQKSRATVPLKTAKLRSARSRAIAALLSAKVFTVLARQVEGNLLCRLLKCVKSKCSAIMYWRSEDQDFALSWNLQCQGSDVLMCGRLCYGLFSDMRSARRL